MDKQTQLKKLFASRLNSYKRYTKKIRDILEPGFQHIQSYLLERVVQPGCIITFGPAVQVADQGVVLVTVYVAYPPGHLVNTETGDRIPITENTAPYFKYTIHVGMPYELFFGDKEPVIQFLELNQQDEQFVNFKENITQLFGPITTNKIAFDLDQLTEQQKKALQHSIINDDLDHQH